MEDKLDIISKKMSVIISLLLADKSDNISQKDMIAKLVDAGLANGEIASILGVSPNAVAIAKSRMNNGGKNGTK